MGGVQLLLESAPACFGSRFEGDYVHSVGHGTSFRFYDPEATVPVLTGLMCLVPDRLDVGELVHAQVGKFAPETALLNTSNRDARV